jgi:hypothetical protein
MNNNDDGLPIEEFIQALTSQLDRAQATMRVKARFGMPLTFAVKDISIDLRAHIEMLHSQVRIRPAGPNDGEASVVHLSLTTITRPMIEENTFQTDADEPSLKEVLGEDMSDDERRRLEWAGIHSVSQLREMQRQSGESVVEQVVQIPAMRLRAALERASQPHVSRISVEPDARLRIHGRNLMLENAPVVRIGGEPATVLQASAKELLVAPLVQPLAGMLSIETAPGMRAERAFETSSVGLSLVQVAPSLIEVASES